MNGDESDHFAVLMVTSLLTHCTPLLVAANTECANASVCANATTHGGCFVNQTTGNDTCFCDSGFELDANSDCQLER